MKNYTLLFLLLFVTILSCQEEKKEVFQYEPLGWSMELPNDWKVLEKAQVEKQIKEATDELADSNIKITGKEKVILKIEKSELNNLQATSTPFKESYKGEWHARYPLLKKQLHDLFKNTGARVDTSSATYYISGITFEVFDIDISEPLSRTKFYKRMYRTYLKEQDFVVNVTYEKGKYGRQLEDAFLNSTFE